MHPLRIFHTGRAIERVTDLKVGVSEFRLHRQKTSSGGEGFETADFQESHFGLLVGRDLLAS